MMTQPDLTPLMKKRTASASLDGAGMGRLLNDEGRCKRLVIENDDLMVDFTRQALTEDDLDALIAHAEAAGVTAKRDAMLNGAVVNASEGRSALHARLRDSDGSMMAENLNAMAGMAEKMLATGVEDVVSIGIGGSSLGPEMVLSALAPLSQGPRIHCASSIDPADLGDVLASLNPRATGFIVISKTFTTRETLANWGMAKQWLKAGGSRPDGRVVAVTAAPDAARAQGFDAILPMDEAIGGRFSLWSGVGLGVMLAFGRDVFVRMLAGAEAMDRHFATAPVPQNIPILCGLMRFWNTGLGGIPGLAVIPYDSRLKRLPAWLQQLEMESNGKSIGIDGEAVQTGTAPIIFGEPGSSAEHSFFQMLHQGKRPIAVDLLAALEPTQTLANLNDGSDDGFNHIVQTQHRDLLALMMAQADALALGRRDEGGGQDKGFPGGRPVTVMTWRQTTPFALGRVLALYEHITAVSGWLYGINSFDQPGVELGKRLARDYIAWLDNDIGGDAAEAGQMPPTTAAILAAYRKA